MDRVAGISGSIPNTRMSPGIRGNVDENAFYGTPPEWRSFLALAPSSEPAAAPEAAAATPETTATTPEPPVAPEATADQR